MILPTQNYEIELAAKGYRYIAGIDEAGRGAWAGPLVAAAVIMPHDFKIKEVRDSKLLSAKNRESLFIKIKKVALDWSVGIVDVDFINQYNIGAANIKAFEQSISGLSIEPDYLLLDGILKIKSSTPYYSIKDGDAKVYSIAAASIIAKVTRDEILKKAHVQFPAYGFSKHKGYGTKAHIQALERYGISEFHRVLYKPIQKFIHDEKNIKTKLV